MPHSRSDEQRWAGRRIRALSAVVGMGFLLVVVQLWYLQALEGPRLAALSERNRLHVRPLPATRGMLYDRTRVPLVENLPSFALWAIPRDLGPGHTVLTRLSALLGASREELTTPLRSVPPDSPWPVRIREGLTFEQVVRVEEWRLDLPGVVVEAESRRAYPSTRFAAHVLGYVRGAGGGQAHEWRGRRMDRAGQSGLEQMLDEFLRGRDGTEHIEVDAFGRPLRVIGREPPRPGASVVTSIDHRIQAAAEQALGDMAGAVVVMDPRNGDVLAMVSRPAFDPARFTGAFRREEWLRLVRDPGHPLLNRTFQSQFPPGSIFKLVVASAALHEGIITPSDRLACPAGLRIGDRTFRNWKDQDGGRMELERAIAVSCNTVFYQLGLALGVERIARYARSFGFGEVTGLALHGEKPGLVLFRGSAGRPWRPGETANLSIGQGSALVTPLQVARFMAAIANDGILWRPRLVHQVEAAGSPLLEVSPEATGRVMVAPSVLAVVRRALWAAVNQGGTGAAAAIPGVAVAGKTGTAQLVEDSDSTRGEDHAWFAGYAPADEPQVVVVVLVERGGMGGKVAAPVARRIFFEVLRGSAA